MEYTISSIPVVSEATFARPYFPLTAKIPKLPLQKGRAHMTALTTGIDEMVYCSLREQAKEQGAG